MTKITEMAEIAKMKELTKFIEGYRDEVYTDSRGYLTVGVGHKLTKAELQRYHEGQKLPKQLLDKWLDADLLKAKEKIASKWNYNLNTPMGRVVWYLCYNIGITGLFNFKRFRTAYEDGDLVGMLRELGDSLWSQQVPRAYRIVTNYLIFDKLREHKIKFADCPDGLRQSLGAQCRVKGIARLLECCFTM